MAKSGGDLKLLGGWFSPFALRVQIALSIKGLKYENVEEDLNSKSELLLHSNPVHKKIPVLLHDAKPICESGIIVEYIDEVWSDIGPSILPQNAYDKANARFWASFIDDKLFASMKGVLFAGEDEEAKKPQFEQMEEALARLEEVLKGKSYFGGDKIGLIDIYFGSFLNWIKVIEEMNGRKVLIESKIPCLVDWAENFASDSSIKELLPETQKLAEFGKALQQKLLTAAANAAK